MISALIAAAAFSFASELPVTFEGRLAHPRILMIKVAPPFDRRLLAKTGSQLMQFFPQIDWASVQIGRGTSLASTKSSLEKIPGIVRVEPDRASFPAYEPNDAMWPEMWHFTRINANAAWDISKGSPSTVAVIDTGVQWTHPDLSANIWSNSDEIPGNGIDDDNNGYIDDVNGFDFAYNDSMPDDVYGHGTPCAGLVGAVQDNLIGVTGVAPNARIMCLKACYDSGYFYDHMTIPAYLYAADNGARVLSMSYFSDHVSAGERDAINYCWERGVLPVAAAANENSTIPLYPAAYENVLSVAALNRNDDKASFSNYGTWVDVIAPGVQLRSTALGGGYTQGFGGTSGACPHVAGLATLLFGAAPLSTNAAVRAAIEDTAVLQTQAPYGEYANYGLVDCYAAMQSITGSPAPPKLPVVRYITPLTYDQRFETVNQVSRIYGRGFQFPAVLEVFVDGQPLTILDRSRDWIDVENPSVRGTLTVKVDGVLYATFALPTDIRKTYTAIEANSEGATVTGGFAQMYLNDGSELSCSRRDDGTVFLETTFRRVEKTLQMILSLKRRYTSTASASESVSLYDWSSASYPYGNFVQVGASTVGASALESSYLVNNAWRFIDDEGTVICRIDASGVGNNGQLRIDSLRYSVP